MRKAAIAVFAGAAISAVIGSIYGLRAFDRWDKAESHCPEDGCDSDGLRFGREAEAAADVSTVGFVTTGILAAGGAVLWWRGKRGGGGGAAAAPATEQRTVLGPTLLGNRPGLELSTRF